MPRFSECWRCGEKNSNITCRNCDVAKYCSIACSEDDIVRHDAECRPVHLFRTCSYCRSTNRNTQVCTGCYRAFYCNAECQKNDRKEHKSGCKRVKQNIKSLADEFTSFLSLSAGICPVNYYWGNVPAYDCLNLAENEGRNYSAEINVLYLAMGDLRNVLLTCASLPESCTSKISCTLNDIDECVMARSVLLLYMLIKCDSRVEKPLTEIWYSTTLSELTYNYLCATLEGLLAIRDSEKFNSETGGLIRVNDKDLKKLKTVWKKWLKLKVQGTSWIREQRGNLMTNSHSCSGAFSYLYCIPREHYSSAKLWMEHGSFRRTQMPVFAENSTLTGPEMVNWGGADLATANDPYVYSAPTSSGVIPFTGWDYVEVKKYTHDDSLVSMYGKYIESKLRSVAAKLSSKQISFKVILGDCMKIGDSLDIEMKYDRIITSNMMDYVLLPDLLRLYSGKLNRENPFATLTTETVNWIRFSSDADINGKESQEFRNIALQDTGNEAIASNWGTSFREYFDNSHHFRDYLRAIFYAYRVRQSSGQSSRLPCLKELGNEFHLRLRDCFRNENRIVFFKQAVNRRRVTMITGLERYLEWVSLPKD